MSLDKDFRRLLRQGRGNIVESDYSLDPTYSVGHFQFPGAPAAQMPSVRAGVSYDYGIHPMQAPGIRAKIKPLKIENPKKEEKEPSTPIAQRPSSRIQNRGNDDLDLSNFNSSVPDWGQLDPSETSDDTDFDKTDFSAKAIARDTEGAGLRTRAAAQIAGAGGRAVQAAERHIEGGGGAKGAVKAAVSAALERDLNLKPGTWNRRSKNKGNGNPPPPGLESLPF